MLGLDASYPELVSALREHYGRRAPPTGGDTPFEAILAVVLGRTFERRKVATILRRLREAGWLDPEAWDQADLRSVADDLEAEQVRLSPRVLQSLGRVATWFLARRDAIEAPRVSEVATDTLRDELRALRGIGATTAEAILLWGLGRPAFPVDPASFRVAVRHGWLDPADGYDEARATFERLADGDSSRLSELAVGLDQVGRDFCRVRAPRCEPCPLRPWLPENGPREPD